MLRTRVELALSDARQQGRGGAVRRARPRAELDAETLTAALTRLHRVELEPTDARASGPGWGALDDGCPCQTRALHRPGLTLSDARSTGPSWKRSTMAAVLARTTGAELARSDAPAPTGPSCSSPTRAHQQGELDAATMAAVLARHRAEL